MSFESDLPPAIRALKAVCRCNNIKYKTIEKCILDGAKCVADVAKKTRATTGYCGGSCTPEIQWMIDRVHGGVAPEEQKQENAANELDAWWARPEKK